MSKKTIPSATFTDTKPHYNILNGLRGVAALMVLIYHLFEAYATSPIDQGWNHGYLAVPFFFILSGFVIGYAYDDRWTKMTPTEFFKRRLIRLHPMVVLGVVLGALSFILQGSIQWDGTKIGTSLVMLAILFTLFMIPAAPGSAPEIRGNGELFPLNGPYWSLFFEYIANVLYVLFIRKLSIRNLKIWVGLTGVGLAGFAIGNGSGYGHLGVGWTMADYNFWAGLLCVSFCFSAGLLVSRVFKPIRIRGAFWICSLAVVALTAVPHLGGAESPWINGMYDTFCVVFLFPLLIWLGASGQTTDAKSTALCKLLGDLSYPVYVIHYPSMYLFYAWVWNNDLSFAQSWYVGVGVIVANILLAYLFLKIYDEPVRRSLSKRFLPKRTK